MMGGTMNNQEKAKHYKNLKKLKKSLKNQGNKYMEVPGFVKGTLTRKLYEGRYDNEVMKQSRYIVNLFKF